jgi:predicted DNA-binding transcriptional regulator AlpA
MKRSSSKAAAGAEALPAEAVAQMTGLSRAGFYRWRVPRRATPVEMELRGQMQKVPLESPVYGFLPYNMPVVPKACRVRACCSSEKTRD